MPRVPVAREVAVPGETGIRPYAFEPIRRGLEGLGQSLIEIGAQADRNALLQARTKILEAVNQGQIAAEETDDPEEMLQRYDEVVNRAQQEVNEELGGRLQGLLAPFSVEAIGSRRFGLIRRQAEMRQQAGIAALDENLDETLKAIDQTPEGIEGMRLREQALGLIESTVGLDPIQRQELRQRFERDIDLQAASKMISGDPDLAARVSADPKQFFTAFPELQPQDRFTVANAARIELNRRETEAREQKARAEEFAINGWLKRVYGPIETLPSVPEILADPVLSPSVKEHFIRLVEDRAEAKPFKTNENKATELYLRVHDSTRPDHITSMQELFPHIGTDISREVAEQLRADINELKADPDRKERDKRLTEFLKNVKSTFTKSTLTSVDVLGDRRYAEFVYEARKRWKLTEEAGKDPIQVLLDPKSSTSLWLLADSMVPTFTENMEAMMKAWARDAADTARRKEEAKKPTRREGEPMNEFWKRLEAWKAKQATE